MRSDPLHPQVLDLDHLVAQTGGDRELERELLALFLQQCRRLLPVIAAEGDARGRAEAAHALRGAALAVGAGRIAALTAAIEATCDNEEHAGAPPALASRLATAIRETDGVVARRQADVD